MLQLVVQVVVEIVARFLKVREDTKELQKYRKQRSHSLLSFCYSRNFVVVGAGDGRSCPEGAEGC